MRNKKNERERGDDEKKIMLYISLFAKKRASERERRGSGSGFREILFKSRKIFIQIKYNPFCKQAGVGSPLSPSLFLSFSSLFLVHVCVFMFMKQKNEIKLFKLIPHE